MSKQIEMIAEDIMESDDLGELVYAIVEEASKRFAAANAADDFCLQSVGPNCVIFGGTNRVKWTPAKGYTPDALYCTYQFLRNWNDSE